MPQTIQRGWPRKTSRASIPVLKAVVVDDACDKSSPAYAYAGGGPKEERGSGNVTVRGMVGGRERDVKRGETLGRYSAHYIFNIKRNKLSSSC